MNAAIYGIPDDVAQARTVELSTMLEMTDKLTTPVRKLSLGERMKAELLASLLHAPPVLFLDEPTLGLDVNAQASVRAFLKSYNAQHQATILLTSHYMQDITALCERVIVIHEGSLIHDGSLEVLSQRFGNTRELHLELAEDVPAERFGAYGAVREQRGRLVRIAVDPKDLVRTVERVLKELPVVDLTVKDAPIEDIVGRVLRGETHA